MANADQAYGFKPVQHENGSPWNGQTERMYVPASDSNAMYIGMPVKLAGSADTDGVPSIVLASPADVLVGVVVSWEPVTADSLVYRAASTERYANVCTDPSVLYSIQEDSVSATLAAADVGLNTNFAVTTGSTVTGLSAAELDSDAKGTTATLDMQILRLLRKPDNEIGANAEWLVRLNNHQRVDGVTGIS